jgi:hypothetical protein
MLEYGYIPHEFEIEKFCCIPFSSKYTGEPEEIFLDQVVSLNIKNILK